MLRYERLNHLSTVLPPQRSAPWYTQRFLSSNSSMYDSMHNTNGQRVSQLKNAVDGVLTPTNFPMSWGTTMEETSGYVFTAITGLRYKELGSLGHPDNERIRGSVDGYGIDKDEKLFVLETKTPYSRVPGPKLESLGYYYQVLQNIEITNGDYGLFNDVRLLPCPTDLLFDVDAAYDPCTESMVRCSFSRYNIAATAIAPINLVAIAVFSSEDLEASYDPDGATVPDTWLGNLYDAYTDQNSCINLGTLKKNIIGLKYIWKPMGYTQHRGESVREWSELMYAAILSTAGTIGCAFVKLDVHNIERIERNRTFWETRLRPIAEKWLVDIDKAKADVAYLDSLDVEEKEERHIPWA